MPTNGERVEAAIAQMEHEHPEGFTVEQEREYRLLRAIAGRPMADGLDYKPIRNLEGRCVCGSLTVWRLYPTSEDRDVAIQRLQATEGLSYVCTWHDTDEYHYALSMSAPHSHLPKVGGGPNRPQPWIEKGQCGIPVRNRGMMPCGLVRNHIGACE